MPADLDRLYAALGTHVDDMPLADPGAVRQRPRRLDRSRLLVAAVAGAVLLAGTAIGVGWFTTSRHTPDPDVPPVAPGRLMPVGGGIPMRLGVFGESGSYGMTSVVGDRAFGAARASDGILRIGAIDLASGKTAWPTRDLGHWGDWNGMTALPQGVIVVGEHDDGTNPDHVAMVIDPDTGALRWQVGVDDLQWEPYESVLVVLSSTDHAIRGVDWRTGEERWRRPIDPRDGSRIVRNYSTTAPAVARGPSGAPTPAGDDRLLLIDPDGTLHVYDARTGAPLAAHPGAAQPATGDQAPLYQAYDGTLYAVSTTRPTRLTAFDLTRADGIHTLYTAPADDKDFPQGVWPCGTGLVCLISQGGPGTDRIVAIDTKTRRELWQRQMPNAQTATALGDRILTGGGQLYDRDGTELLNVPLAVTGWVTPETALLLTRTDPSNPGADADVATVSATDGTRTPVGRIPTMTGFCSWNTKVLVCPTTDGFRAWRFAPG